MSRYHAYLRSAARIIESYKGEEPLAYFLKKYFAKDKKYGSKDRKQISHLCYCYFRMGKAFTGIPPEEAILCGLFLCTSGKNELLEQLNTEFNDNVQLSVDEKFSVLGHPGSLELVFPWKDKLSRGINHREFCASFFIQPDLFLRIRPGKAEKVLMNLSRAGAEFEFISPFSIRLPNSFPAGKLLQIDREVVIQDLNSQRLSHYLPVNHGKLLSVWDCCAGSGGKSILAFDLNPEIELTVSDNRNSMHKNLKERFKKAGIKDYRSLKTDLTHSPLTIDPSQFDLIIADVPCTGSGTWARTPEQLFYFNTQLIEEYCRKQKEILMNVIPHLKKGGTLVYITCSVFRKENEDIADFVQQHGGLKLKQMELLKGYDQKADSLFVAVFNA